MQPAISSSSFANCVERTHSILVVFAFKRLESPLPINNNNININKMLQVKRIWEKKRQATRISLFILLWICRCCFLYDYYLLLQLQCVRCVNLLTSLLSLSLSLSLLLSLLCIWSPQDETCYLLNCLSSSRHTSCPKPLLPFRLVFVTQCVIIANRTPLSSQIYTYIYINYYDYLLQA